MAAGKKRLRTSPPNPNQETPEMADTKRSINVDISAGIGFGLLCLALAWGHSAYIHQRGELMRECLRLGVQCDLHKDYLRFVSPPEKDDANG
jgi:hypothetical protein